MINKIHKATRNLDVFFLVSISMEKREKLLTENKSENGIYYHKITQPHENQLTSKICAIH